MREKMMEVVCESIHTDNCIAHCNHPHCGVVQTIVQNLIANGVTIQKWISARDRLPEMHTKVLCCGIKGGRFIAELSSWGHENHLYWTKRDGKGCSEPTHWMPMPEPPKED